MYERINLCVCITSCICEGLKHVLEVLKLELDLTK